MSPAKKATSTKKMAAPKVTATKPASAKAAPATSTAKKKATATKAAATKKATATKATATKKAATKKAATKATATKKAPATKAPATKAPATKASATGRSEASIVRAAARRAAAHHVAPDGATASAAAAPSRLLAPKIASASSDDRPILLDVQDVRAGFGVTTVLHGLSLTVHEGEIVGIFGLNGAGKSVSMKVLAGVVPVWSGRISFGGQDITNLLAERRVAAGMGHVPQGRQVFPALTVEENLRLGAYTMRRTRRERYAGALAAVYDRFPLLAERRDQAAGTLSGGQQAALAVARALINEPRLVLVDEPSAGLSPVAVRELFTTLKAVAATGVTMVLVEQNVAFGLQLADRANILQNGRIVYAGDVSALDQDALARYLGIGRMLGAATGAALTGRRAPNGPATPTATTTRAGRSARSGGGS